MTTVSQVLTESRCGTIALIGRPNVGKSTLMNSILGEKVSITSNKPQTTRLAIRGIKTIGQDQYIYIDTPGVHKNKKSDLQKMMLREATHLLHEVNVIILIIESHKLTEEDEWLLSSMKEMNVPIILVLNKVDLLADKGALLPKLVHYQKLYSFAGIVPLSALKKDNVQALEKLVATFLPFRPHLFPKEQLTDQDETFYIAELIREQVFRQTHREIPYQTKVEVEDFEESPELIRIQAIITVTREGQKKIIIGAQGQQLKNIGRISRLALENFFGKKIFLKLWVKVS